MRLSLKSKKITSIAIFCMVALLVYSSVWTSQIESVYGLDTQVEKTIPVLMYHHLTEEPSDAKNVTITQDKFRTDMKYLEKKGYTALLPQDLLAIKAGRMKLPENPIVITFDDGYRSNYDLAFPVLLETGMKATIFVVTSGIETEKRGHIPKLSWEQMKEMYDSGSVDIQTHSHNLHNAENKGMYSRFGISGMGRTFIESRAMYDLRILEDIGKSKELIEKNVGTEVVSVAYPFGVYEEWCERPLEEMGIALGFIIGNQSADLYGQPYNLARYNVNMDTKLWKLIREIEGLSEETYC